MSDENDTMTDGGTVPDFLVDTPASSRPNVSRMERATRFVDRYFLTQARIAWTDWRTRFGIIVLGLFVFTGTVGVHLVPEPGINEAETYMTWFQSWKYPLGTDNMGQPIHKQLVHSTPAVLKMGLAGAIFAAGVAVVVGTVAGYRGGFTDYVLMLVSDILMVIPGLPLIVVLAAIWQPRDPFTVGVILAIDSWPGLARTIRSQVLTLREEEYVEASRSMGVSIPSILQKDIVPQLMPYVLINSAQAARGVIFASVALYFLGFLPYTEMNWGVMMNEAYSTGGALSNPQRAAHWLYPPMLALVLLSFSLVLLSQGLDRVFNPRLRARHSKTVDDDGAEVMNR
ncbi:nickel transporter permease NikC [Halalkalicoccus paucihalophilus]|uniref:Nickel transporter permease NikC n=1 Tax=Halalkalicoccus paucihalophilus TaxID=1008153 RepID=A0A151AA21_9EURY|nr:ABC transporter permease [Halalkalicoccus paucihalophilus]KYH24469.1 nickel transporter permease NikC [Halalkalicoccus paucihalophilus]